MAFLPIFYMSKTTFRVFLRISKNGPLGYSIKIGPSKNIDFALLKNFTQVQDVDLSNTNLVDGDLVYLRNLSQLKRLNIVGTQISDAGLNNLIGLKT